MIPTLAFAVAVLLIAVAAVHSYWGMGGTWPARDERSLARMVVGSKGIEHMPSPGACHAVAVALLAMMLLPLADAGVVPVPWPRWLTTFGLAGAALIFLGRGTISYIPAFRKFGPEEPFATYDKKYYAPLCLTLGTAFLILLLW